MAEALDVDLRLLKQHMIETGGFREWSCKMDSELSDPLPFLLKFSANGGVSGCGRLNTYFRSWGDVFGKWDSVGVDFKFVDRIKYRREEVYFFKGKWNEEDLSVKGNVTNEWDEARLNGGFHLFRGSSKEEKNSKDCASNRNIFADNMKKYLMNSTTQNQFCDFKIEANDGSIIEANRIILASQTAYFDKMFKMETRDSARLEFPGPVVRQVVTFLYTGEVEITGDIVQDLITLANFLQLPSLEERCEQFIVGNLEVSNCIGVFELGVNLSNAKLKEMAAEVLVANFQTCLNEEKDSNLVLMTEFIFKRVMSDPKLILFSQYGTILEQKHRIEALNILKLKYCEVHKLPEGEISLQTAKDALERKFDQIEDWDKWNEEDVVLGRSINTLIREVEVEDDILSSKEEIRAVWVCCVDWGGRRIVGGLRIEYSDRSVLKAGTMEEEESESVTKIEVPEGEHITLVVARADMYVDSLTFISSSGLPLGPAQPVGGDGGDLYNTLQNLDPRFNCFNTNLKGFKCKEVSTENKVVITDLTFKYRIVGDASYTQPEDHELDGYDEYDFPGREDYEQDYEQDDVASVQFNSDSDSGGFLDPGQ